MRYRTGHTLRRNTLLILAISALTLIAASPGTPVNAQGDGVHPERLADKTGEENPTSGDPALDAAAAKLMEDEGLPFDEASVRIERQAALFDAAADFQRQAGDTWGGAYIDHGAGGALVLQTTKPATLARAVGTTVQGAPVEVRPVRVSEPAMTAATVRLIRDLEAAGYAAVSATVDVVTGRVSVTVPRDADRDAAKAAEERASMTLGEDRFTISFDGNTARHQGCYSQYTMCDAPLRGGYAIRDTQIARNSCTAGFMVKSRSDSKRYVLTAGHCVAASGTGSVWETRMPQDDLLHNIGPAHNFLYTCCGKDVAIISVTNSGASGWDPGPFVRVLASGGSRPTAAASQYRINGVGSSAAIPGGYLCSTGASSMSLGRGTRCGAFFASGLHYDNGGDDYADHPVNSMGVVDMPSCDGDSGSPIYVGNLGYGILSAGTNPDSYGYYIDNGIRTYSGLYCTQTMWYVGLAGALSDLNVELL